MTKINRKFNQGLLIALTATLATVAQPQPASAQLLDIAAGAFNAFVKSKKPQPQVIQQRVPVPVPTPSQPRGPEFNVGTNNANGNNFNLCISNCLPSGHGTVPARYPQQVVPAQVPMRYPQQVVPTRVPTRYPQQVAPTRVPAPIAQQQGSVSSSTMINQNSAVANNGATSTRTTQSAYSSTSN
ncbi:hypothetical protein [Pleurocapsa sp. PCC 7319]|uniref:hypothetical protein n=1 Tax=Pleurocapsa sp. PCC 7319 TaxID=118161 RepID=UPI00034C3B55|nr:hypothetical protein [Pleurocapsa sp. PCC 7319]